MMHSLEESLYRSVALARRTEERISEIYDSDKVKSPVHLAIGQEYIAVAVCENLTASDYVSATYRGHAAYLAKGGDLDAMVAELYGKETGCAKGRAGSMHLVEPNANVIGMSAVVGTSVPTAIGYALACKMQKRNDVVVCFFGDGSTEEGAFLESVNFAALKKLPILFVCENNGYAIHEPIEKRWATNKLIERVETYGIRVSKFETPDIMAINQYSRSAIKRIREGGGPEFIECLTYRFYEHVGPNKDFDQGYRSTESGRYWLEQDVYHTLGQTISSESKAAIDQALESRLDAAFTFAEASAFPDKKELKKYVFSE